MDCLYFMVSLPYCLVCVLQPCGHLGKGWPMGSPVCDVFLCNLPLSYTVTKSWVRCGT